MVRGLTSGSPGGPALASLRTARLDLRRLGPADRALVASLNADRAVMRYVGNGRPMPDTQVDEDLRWMTSFNGRPDGLGYWAAFESRSSRFVGWFTATPDADPDRAQLGYRLVAAAWGHGYATEGALRMLGLAREAGLRTVFATTMAVNVASRRVLEKVGLHHARTWHGDWDEPIPGAEQGDVDYELAL